MTRRLSLAFCVLNCLAVAQVPAFASQPAPGPMPDRIALAQTIVIGKVTAIEDKAVLAKRFPTEAKQSEFKIAVIQIAEALKGAKGLTTIRLGFVPPPPVQPGLPLPVGGLVPRNITAGLEGCFFLNKHTDADFHVAPMYYDIIEKRAANFDKDVELIKRCGKLLDDPLPGLKSKDADERLLTALVLLNSYKDIRFVPAGAPIPPAPKTEPIDPETSKLILQALLTADWNKRDPFSQLSPQVVFVKLNLTAKDGWAPPQFKDYQKEYPAFAQKWLKEHVTTYRIQRVMR